VNLVCVCLDTLRADAVGEDKGLRVDTPNLDAFAREGVTFDNAFGEGQPTLQIRRAFFTGMRSFPWRFNFDRRGHWHHASGWHKIPPDQDTLAEVLLGRGYMTGLVSDTYHMFKATMNYTRGFVTYDFVRGQESDNWRGGSARMVEERLRRHVRPPVHRSRYAVLVQYLLNTQDRRREEDYFCAQVFTRASQWLEDNVENRPFFLWVDGFDPHEPWDPPTGYADRYRAGYEGLDFIFPQYAGVATPEEQERIRALYLGEVTFVDEWFGRFTEKIGELGLWDETVVMLLSDHGTQLLEHGRFGKGGDAMHPYNTRINWVIRHPDGPRGRHIKPFVQSHDLMPTALRLLGVPHARAEGEDVWPLVTGERSRIRDHVVIGWASMGLGPAPGRASVRDEEWNYVTHVHQEDPRPELYYLPTDPEERKNVVAEHPDVVARQRSRLEAVLGQPLPATLPELCDMASPPIVQYSLLRPEHRSESKHR